MEQVASSKIARFNFDVVRVFCDDRGRYENRECRFTKQIPLKNCILLSASGNISSPLSIPSIISKSRFWFN